jgi:hypothetical protein
MDANGRISARDKDIWDKYIGLGLTYMDLAEEHNLSYQRISQIINEVRNSIPKPTNEEVVATRLAQLNLVTKAVIPKAAAGDASAINSLLRIQERESKYKGLDSASKIEHSGGLSYEIAGLEDLPEFDLNE